MAGPTAASTPAKSQLKTSRIPVRKYSSHQEIRSTAHKVTQPFAESSKSLHSVSIGNSSPRVLSSIGGASSEHYSTSLHHPTVVTMTQKQQHHPTVIMTAQHHHHTGVLGTQQHHPLGVMTTQQHHPIGVMTTQQHHPTGVTVTQQHHPTGAIVTQANNVGYVNSTRLSGDTIPVDNSIDVSSGNRNTCTHTHARTYVHAHTHIIHTHTYTQHTYVHAHTCMYSM